MRSKRERDLRSETVTLFLIVVEKRGHAEHKKRPRGFVAGAALAGSRVVACALVLVVLASG